MQVKIPKCNSIEKIVTKVASFHKVIVKSVNTKPKL